MHVVTQVTSIDRVASWIDQIAPRRLAEDWDNVGLLVGHRSADVSRVLVCLTLSPDVAQEAIATDVNLVVAHHPIPFRPISRITDDTTGGAILLKLLGHGIAVYSAHTAWDSAIEGINAMWAELLSLVDIGPIVSADSKMSHDSKPEGAGRIGRLESPATLSEIASRITTLIPHTRIRAAGDAATSVTKVAIACGSGGSFLSKARREGADVLVTGEATYHDALEAKFGGPSLLMVGHFASERFAMEALARRMADEFPTLRVSASEVECDPVCQWSQ